MMKNLINKYVIFFSIGIMICFFIFIGISNLLAKPNYSLLVYENSLSSGTYKTQTGPVKGLVDPDNKIFTWCYGVPELGIPDKRIQISNTPLYVLVKQKNQEILFITDNIKKLNEYIKNKIR